jgi:hypothetical protein
MDPWPKNSFLNGGPPTHLTVLYGQVGVISRLVADQESVLASSML